MRVAADLHETARGLSDVTSAISHTPVHTFGGSADNGLGEGVGGYQMEQLVEAVRHEPKVVGSILIRFVGIFPSCRSIALEST
jgi:hypothetical protein